jgi:hypothetical protein
MKLKLWMRKLSAGAPSVTVRPTMPWPFRVLLAVLVLTFSVAAGLALYEYLRSLGGPTRDELVGEITDLRARLAAASNDRARLTAQVTTQDTQMKVDRAAQEQLAKQVAALEVEANRLREDLAFFESLLPARAGAKGLVIRSFRVQPEGGPNEHRYRLLVQQAGKPEQEFIGTVQLQVNYTHAGRNFALSIPEAQGSADSAPRLAFRHYQRVEGSFTLPAGAIARSVLVKIISGGQTQVQQSFAL